MTEPAQEQGTVPETLAKLARPIYSMLQILFQKKKSLE